MSRSWWHYFLIGFVLFFLSSNAFGGAWLSPKIETDADADGFSDSTIYYFYNDDCTLSEMRTDADGDGTIDSYSYTTYTYNSGGYYVIVKLEQDLDANGTIDQIIYTSQNADGTLIVTENDSDADGTIDSFTSACLDDGNVPTTMEYYEGSGAYDGGGTLTTIHYYTYDAQCNKIQDEYDSDADGQVDEITYTDYDEKCRPITVKVDSDNDGENETITQHAYDEGGLVCRTEIDKETVTYGITITSNFVYEMVNTYNESGYNTKIVTTMTGSQTMYGQTVEVEPTTIISSTTWVYDETAECEQCDDPYASECGCPDGSGGDDGEQTDSGDGISPVSARITGSFESGDPVTVTVSGSAESGETLYYKFYYCAGHGTDAYETNPWVVMQPYSTSATCEYTFPEDGNYVVVVRIVTDPDNEPENLPIVGGVVSIGSSDNPRIEQLSSGVSGSVSPNTPVTYTITASDSRGDAVYYKWFYRAGYGTDAYDTNPWVVVQPYSTSSSCEYTFPDEGDYIVVVRAVTDPDNEPADLPIIGGTVTCSE